MKKLYFLIVISLCILLSRPGSAQFNVLHNFNDTDGANPYSGKLVLSGNKLFGMTAGGGISNYGTIFSIDTNGLGFKVLLYFNGSNGRSPLGSLIILGNKLYGMAKAGAANTVGCIFSIDTDGSGYKDLWDFGPYGTNGEYPCGSLTFYGNKLFGTTSSGGIVANFGSIFSIDTNGSNFKNLLYFNYTSNPYGSVPQGSLTISNGVMYGMAYSGGAFPYQEGCIFSIDTDGSGYKDMLDFNGTNGSSPLGDLSLCNGVLYGMTYLGGGVNNGCVFSIKTDGTGYRDLFDFSGPYEGFWPMGSLTQSGNLLYGMTLDGGANDVGEVFSIDTSGSGFKHMFHFNDTDGANPESTLILSGNYLYGTASNGGVDNSGVIFKINTRTFDLDSTVRVSLNQLKTLHENITLYPNPSKGIFTITSKNLKPTSGMQTIAVFNVLGEKVSSNPFTICNSPFTIDLSNQPNGIYLYRVITESGELVGEGKMVIQK